MTEFKILPKKTKILPKYKDVLPLIGHQGLKKIIVEFVIFEQRTAS